MSGLRRFFGWIARQEPSPPQYLYKFLSINSPYHSRILTQGVFYLSHVSQFNDPFEGRIYPRLAYTKEEALKLLDRQVEKLRRQGKEQEAGDMQRSGTANISKIYQSQQSKKDFFESILSSAHSNPDFPTNRTGIVCFSERDDDILMWSHYSDKHQGYCLQFAPGRDQKIWKSCYRVTYTDSYPEFIFDAKSNRNVWREMIATKASQWSYEKEWRMLVTGRVREEMTFPPAILTGVIFGCEMKKESKDKIRRWTAGKQIRYFEARRRTRKFGLDIVEVR